MLGCPVGRWVDDLMFCEMCLNSHLSASTRSTADMLTFGQELHQPLDLAGGMGPEAPAATSVAGVVRERLALARQCVAHAQAYQKPYFDAHHQALELSMGQ